MKDNKLFVKCCGDEEEEQHPHCPHGPTLLFYTEQQGQQEGYYSCSAFRNKKDCNFQVKVKDVNEKLMKKTYDIDTEEWQKKRLQLLELKEEERVYCHTCNEPVFDKDQVNHKDHRLVVGISNELLKDPTSLLEPFSLDQAQAQYFFDQKALTYFEQCLQTLAIRKVLCIGAPRLHCYLRQKNFESFLLDFDRRFFYFLSNEEFAWFNMCNNWFFVEKQKQEFHRFLRSNNEENLLIITDPPFACRTEPIANTLRQITRSFNQFNNYPHKPLPIFWIFPYFAENYIREEMPELEMCNYLVNYTNHLSYTDTGSKSRSQGSPVRIFTNVPLKTLPLPEEDSYKFCHLCQHFVLTINSHCNRCKTCPSKNGGLYKHCPLCGQCVKENYQHCSQCRRCTQVLDHHCETYQKHQYCWICGEKGHTEFNCLNWQNFAKRQNLSLFLEKDAKEIVCMLCGETGHNEKSCHNRSDYIEESVFLGVKHLTFKK